MITVVITSFNRPDLLRRTIESFEKFNSDPIAEVIIIEDSANISMRNHLRLHYSNYHLIINDENLGAYASIDKAYAQVMTPYVVHIEDDWEFYKGGFIKPALDVLRSNSAIMQVNLSNEQNMPIEPEVFKAGETEYRLEGTDKDGYWHGFTCNPSVRNMEGYKKTKPWDQYAHKSDEGYFLALHEMKVGKRYFELGYRAAVLNEYFCKHIGIGRCTWHPNA